MVAGNRRRLMLLENGMGRNSQNFVSAGSHRTDDGELRRWPVSKWLASYEPGKASDYILPIDAIQPGDRFIICARVSTEQQFQDGNLRDQVERLRQIVAERGATVIDVVDFVGPGSFTYWLRDAAEKARKVHANLLAESPCRLVRPIGWRPQNPVDTLVEDFRKLQRATEGVPLVVALMDSDAAPAVVKSCQTKRGQQEKGRKGGRPVSARPGDTKKRREKLLPHVRQLRQGGLSLGEIAKETGIAKSTVQDWIKRHD